MTEYDVVAHARDRNVVRGRTWDFRPDRPWFQIRVSGKATPERVLLEDLKALFFVKSLEGNSTYVEGKQFDADRPGRKTWVEFEDGEVLAGWVEALKAHTSGFFLFPVDTASNNAKLFVVWRSVTSILHDAEAEDAARAHRVEPTAPSLVGRVPDSAWTEFLEQKPRGDEEDISGVFLQDF